MKTRKKLAARFRSVAKAAGVRKKGEVIISTAMLTGLAVLAVALVGGIIFFALRSVEDSVEQAVSASELAYYDPTGDQCDTTTAGVQVRVFPTVEAIPNTGGTWFTAAQSGVTAANARFGAVVPDAVTEGETGLDFNGNGQNDGTAEFTRLLIGSAATTGNWDTTQIANAGNTRVIQAVNVPNDDFQAAADWSMTATVAPYAGISIVRGTDDDGQSCWETTIQYQRYASLTR